MAEKILSEGEMDALMEGVSSGQVQVQTGAGVINADVRTFEIDPKSYLKVGSFPELQRINDTFAEHLQRFFRDGLQWEVSCDLKAQNKLRLTDIAQKYAGLQVGSVFLMSPLQGPGLLIIDGKTLSALVEKFFGSPTVADRTGPIEKFSAGEIRIAQRFTDEVLVGLKRAWEGLIELDLQSVQIEQSLARIKLGAEKDVAILSQFQIDAGELSSELAIVLPLATIADVADALEGASRPGTNEQNSLWARTLRAHLADLRIPISARTNPVQVSLGAVAELEPGAVLPIDSPAAISLFSGPIALLKGEFGTYKERGCVRAQGSIGESSGQAIRRQANG